MYMIRRNETVLKPVAFLFDFDGVVVDSISLHLKAWDQACNELFGSGLSADRRKFIIGMSTRDIAQLLSNEKGSPQQKEALSLLKRQRLSEMREQVPLLPGARQAFAKLTQLNTPYGIASNAPVAFIRQILANEGLTVASVIGIENSGRPKPAPDPFLACAKSLGVTFDKHPEVVIFEDSVHGLKAATDAGMLPIGVETQHSEKHLKDHGARLTCKNLQEAIDRGWLEKLPPF